VNTVRATRSQGVGFRSGASSLAISRRLAIAFGVLTPLAETARRWGSWWDYPAAFVDDFLIGGFLLAGAWATRGRRPAPGLALLAAAWGFACGMAYSSAAAHWFAMRTGVQDPAPIPTQWVFGIKLLGGCIFVVALVLTVRASRHGSVGPFTARPAPSSDLPSNPSVQRPPPG
jgi:hypothetical protein